MTMAAVAAVRRSAIPGHQAGLLVSTFMIAKRDLLKFLRTPQLIVLGSVQLVGFLVTFRYVFGGAFGLSQGLPYVDYSVPGFIAAGVPFTLVGTAVAMASDLEDGFIDRLRSLPMPRLAVLTGRVLADSAILTCNLGIATVVGFAIGFRLQGSVLGGLEAFGMCLIFGLAFSWVFMTLGLFAGNSQAAQGMSLLVFPLTFGSSAYVPVSTFPGWLRAYADNQPVTSMADAVRALTLGSHAQALLGHHASYYVVQSVIWTVAITVVFCVIGLLRYRRG
jgi:ABC-2 type transport system permease protein